MYQLYSPSTVLNCTNPYDIAKIFYNYFASIAETTEKNIKTYCLLNENSSTIFLQTTDKEEIANIISSLNSTKASGLNSIPYRILFLLKMKFRSNWQSYSTSLS